jgi:hypothetical protein
MTVITSFTSKGYARTECRSIVIALGETRGGQFRIWGSSDLGRSQASRLPTDSTSADDTSAPDQPDGRTNIRLTLAVTPGRRENEARCGGGSFCVSLDRDRAGEDNCDRKSIARTEDQFGNSRASVRGRLCISLLYEQRCKTNARERMVASEASGRAGEHS